MQKFSLPLSQSIFDILAWVYVGHGCIRHLFSTSAVPIYVKTVQFSRRLFGQATMNVPWCHLHTLPCHQLCLEPHIYPSPDRNESRQTDSNVQINSHCTRASLLASWAHISLLTFGQCRVSKISYSYLHCRDTRPC